MTKMNQLKTEVAEYLSGLEGLEKVRLLTAYPAGTRAFPLEEPAIAVGLEAVETAPAGLGGYWGDREEAALYGSGVKVTLRFDLYATSEQGGDTLHALYEALCEHLLLRKSPFGFQKIWCDTIDYDKGLAAYHMRAYGALSAALLREDSAVSIEDIQLIHR